MNRLFKNIFLVTFVIIGLCILKFNSSMNNALFALSNEKPVPGFSVPTLDDTKPIVVILASNKLTNITDLLIPFTIFDESKAFNVYIITPEAAFAQVNVGVAVVPHFRFKNYQQIIGQKPDVLVLPKIDDSNNPKIVQWIDDHVDDQTIVLSFAKTTQNFATDSNLTNAFDASFDVLKKFVSKQEVEKVAKAVSFDLNKDVVEHKSSQLTLSENLRLIAAGLFNWKRPKYGTLIYSDMDEIQLSAVLDTYSRSLHIDMATFSYERRSVRSKRGLFFMPYASIEDAQKFDHIIALGHKESVRLNKLIELIQIKEGAKVSFSVTDLNKPFYEQALSQSAELFGEPMARIIAKMIGAAVLLCPTHKILN